MSAATVLQSLFRYKAWTNAELFAGLAAKLDAEKHATERHTAIRLMNHIYVVDRIFAGHLMGQPHGCHGHQHPPRRQRSKAARRRRRPTPGTSAGWQVVGRRLAEPVVTFALHRWRSGPHDARGDVRARPRTAPITAAPSAASWRRSAIPPPRDLYTRYLHTAEPERRQGGLSQPRRIHPRLCPPFPRFVPNRYACTRTTPSIV